MGEQMRIDLSGGGPWGFRLQGDDQGPLRISKVRRRSKASLGDLQEGDILLSANGRNCHSMSHSEAMETIDNAGDRLVLEIIRMPGGASQAQPQPQQTHSMVFNGGAPPSYAQQRTTRTTVKQTFGSDGQTRETRTEQTTVQGSYGGPQTTTVRREERSYGGGPVLQQVSNIRQSSQFQPQTSQFQATPTPYRPPSSQAEYGGQPSPGGQTYDSGVPQFKVKDIKSQQQQQQPSQGIVSSHMDDSGTMTLNIDMGGQPGKENISPQFQQPSRFEPQYAKPQTWQPPSQPPKSEYYEARMSPAQDMMDARPQIPQWEGQQDDSMRPYTEMESEPYERQLSYDDRMEPETFDVATPKLMPATPGMKPVPISKLLQESFDETPPESPSRLRKMILDPSLDYTTSTSKKVYADSSFFEDPLQSFPTVDEQIKLARNVANVLTKEAAQQKSRGAQMFTKRKERAEKYVHENELEDEMRKEKPQHVPAPAAQPKLKMYKCIDPNAATAAPMWKPTPPPPPALLPKKVDNFGPTKTPTPKSVITQEELEQIQLRAPKAQHNTVTPEKCFSLAAALHASKGRGGQIFAKRRAKSESWVIDESNVKSAPRKPQVDPSAIGQARAGLKKTPLKPSKTPWQAALENPTGDVDEAFEHLAANKRHTIGADVFDSLSRKHGWTDPAVPKTSLEAEKKEGPNYKDFNRTARGWGPGGENDEKWSTSSIASEDSGSKKAVSLRSSEDDFRSTPTFTPNRLQFDTSRARMQPQIPHGATPPRMAFPVGGADVGATDL